MNVKKVRARVLRIFFVASCVFSVGYTNSSDGDDDEDNSDGEVVVVTSMGNASRNSPSLIGNERKGTLNVDSLSNMAYCSICFYQVTTKDLQNNKRDRAID